MSSFEKYQPIIIEQCKADSAKHGNGGGMITCTIASAKYKVKYGVTETLMTRINTQPWLHSEAEKQDGLRVPELLHRFDEQGRTYLVMEFVELEEIPPSDMNFRIEVALGWLSGLTNGETLGPLGGGCIVHRFFDEEEAPVPFKTLKALDCYIEQGRKRLHGYKKSTKRVVLEQENLVFTQGIVDPSHFGVAKNGDTVIMGIGNMSFVPHSLARYTLFFSDNLAFAELPDTFGWTGGANMDTMAMVAANLAMTGNPTLGLDENGESTKPKAVAATGDSASETGGDKHPRSAS